MEESSAELEFYGRMQNIEYTDETLRRLEKAVKEISIPEIQQFVVTVVMKFGQEDRLQDALNAFDLLRDFLIQRKQYVPMYPSKMSDTVFAAVLVHNISFYRETDTLADWEKVFGLRSTFEALGKELLAQDFRNDGAFDYIFQICEAQLGEQMPVIACRPVTGQMSYVMWEILWLYYHFVKPLKT